MMKKEKTVKSKNLDFCRNRHSGGMLVKPALAEMAQENKLVFP